MISRISLTTGLTRRGEKVIVMDMCFIPISARKVMMNDLSDVSEINSIDAAVLPKDKYNVLWVAMLMGLRQRS